MEEKPIRKKSVLVESFSYFNEWTNRHFTLASWLIKKGEKEVFYQIEKIMLVIMIFLVAVFFTLHWMPEWLMIVISMLLIQRVVEFVAVYSRNFIFGRGRIFTDFKDSVQRGEWLVLMFSLNALQIALVFSIWYRVISLLNSGAFSQTLNTLDSFYFSVVNFLTIGYGDIVPVSALAKVLVLIQNALTFYIFVIVINGLISIHFIRK